jgi:hypothetical protein
VRDESIDSDIDQIRASLIALVDRYLDGERSVLWPAIAEVRAQLVCLLEESPASLEADLNFLIVRCEALGRLVVN